MKSNELLAYNEEKQRLAEEGDADAMYYLAVCYYNEISPIEPNEEHLRQAIEWASKAIEAGNAWSATLMGHIHSNEKFACFDLQIALNFYRIAYEMGHEYAAECAQEVEMRIGSAAKVSKKIARRRKRG